MENTMGNDEDDAIISVSYGPKHNVTVVYEKDKTGYALRKKQWKRRNI